MADSTYEIALKLTTEGDFGSKLDGFMGSMTSLNDAAGEFASTLTSGFTSAIEKAGALGLSMAKLAAVGAGGAIAYGVGHLNAELEKTEVSLAAIFNANGAANGMADGMRIGHEQMALMRKEAAELPGEFKDLVGIFRASAIPGLRSGMSVDQIRSLAANTMAAGAASGLQMDMVAREMGMLLSGRAGAHNVLGSQIFGLSGDSAKAFNAMDSAKRVEVLNKQLEKFGEAKAMFGQTWEGITSTMVDNGKAILGAATLPLFNSVKTALGEVNNYFDTHKREIMIFAENAGAGLHDAFEQGLKFVDYWGPSLLYFVRSFREHFVGAWAQVEPIVNRIGKAIEKLVTDPEKTWGKLTEVAKLYGATKLTTPIVSGVAGLAEKLEGGGGIAAMAAEAAPAAIAIAALAVSIYGVIDILSDVANPLHDFAIDTVKDIKGNLGELGATAKSAGSDLWDAAKPVVDLMGADLLWSLEIITWTMKEATNAVTAFYTTLGFVAGEIADLFKIDHSKDPKLGADIYDDIQRQGPEVINHAVGTVIGVAAERAAAKTAEKAHKGHGVHVDKVEITVSGQSDPSRVARIVQSKLADLARNPRASRFVPNYSASR